ncbi:3-deoxy-D-manno-octulosonic acid kinase [Halomonas elongata]|uniref:3-deoxy-D-manno-octulosonic acid kinase n=1 Tax=Halomonas elongata TaxID=2746 RepID=A0A1B8NZ42_HALEL|nr:3-deoxy-D-manno-octulosonic acid kinase [Halomonas elongata]MBW5800359.1 3-deoxy-D-manno-octulosonic acid kinase [Halomonas elongata]OBX35248.1 3-deoxy-D-manno-octulosonic acid kinase [Halomonas elongata]RAW08642.1 3-deoxy-D-manno-octulosonic acid kinase [Halomonas elongata]
MRLATYRTGKIGILYDADSLCDADGAPQIGPHLFDPEYWRQAGKVVGEAPGRGASLFIAAGDEQWVLRPYRRGGLIARISTERYLWCGAERSRAFREMRLTAHLHALGLPVPRPVAAGVTRHGLTYEAGLITVRLPDARALAECLSEADEALLHRVGHTIRRFHDAGLDHVDLNARNLLVDPEGAIWLIDLDRCRLRTPGGWQDANLERLARSLAKFDAPSAIAAVREGYASGAAS